MTGPYHYTPYFWLIVTSIAFLVVLVICCIRRRTAPGAVPLSILMALTIPWVLANGLLLAGKDGAARIFWFKLHGIFILPMATASLCFVLEYAGLGRWLTRRSIALLAVVPLAFAMLILTNGMHHLVWTRIWFDGSIVVHRGPAHWVAIGYGFFLSLLQLVVLVRLFLQSPRHRWMALWLILALVSSRGASVLEIAFRNPAAPLNLMVLILPLTLLPYVFAIVRFRMFEVVPVARDAAIDSMTEGFIVLDAESRFADINEAAQRLLGLAKAKVIGKKAEKVLEAYPDLSAIVRNPEETRCELSLGTATACYYQASTSPITDRRGFRLGWFIMLQDITEQKLSQARILGQERALATLGERELLARELHDGIGQLAAAAHLQAGFARDLLTRGSIAQVESCLRDLADTTQEIKKSIREYLVGVKTGSPTGDGFLTGLRNFIEHYNLRYGIQTELVVPLELEKRRMEPTLEAQLQPIIYEALINVRKHSGARSARVIFAPSESRVRVTIEDDGCGFDPDGLSGSRGFGLRSMQGRAHSLGGDLEVDSVPGKGTLVSIEIPWRKDKT